MKEWKATRSYAPKRMQFFKGGVTMNIKEAVTIYTTNGPIVKSPCETITIKVGADGKGYVPRNEKEDTFLLEESKKKDPFGICLFENRQVPKVQREAELRAADERTGRIKAEAQLEEMQKKLKAQGMKFENGKVSKI